MSTGSGHKGSTVEESVKINLPYCSEHYSLLKNLLEKARWFRSIKRIFWIWFASLFPITILATTYRDSADSFISLYCLVPFILLALFLYFDDLYIFISSFSNPIYKNIRKIGGQGFNDRALGFSAKLSGTGILQKLTLGFDNHQY